MQVIRRWCACCLPCEAWFHTPSMESHPIQHGPSLPRSHEATDLGVGVAWPWCFLSMWSSWSATAWSGDTHRTRIPSSIARAAGNAFPGSPTVLLLSWKRRLNQALLFSSHLSPGQTKTKQNPKLVGSQLSDVNGTDR